jgi:glutathione synthase/RimK-type ligase-like ATP-grasp enzyme
MDTVYHFIKKGAPFIPEKLRLAIRGHINLTDYDIAQRKAANPYLNMLEQTYPESPFLFGIIEDVAQYHKYYIAACREMKLSYKVINILDNKWISNFRNSRCDAFLVWPTNCSTVYKQLFDYRLRILESEMGKTIFPTWQECWLTEHKPRLRDWMDAHGIPHPPTWVFYDRRNAISFAKDSPLPLIAKTATGASASGVQIVHSRTELMHVVRNAFGKGLCPRGYDPSDRQRGFIFLQEYLPKVDEWRMVRIGDSFFGYRKERGPTGLHSASHTWSWLDPSNELLDLIKNLTDTGGFTSMDVDIFLTKEGHLLVNECQTVFGCSTPAIQMKVNEIEGRYLWTDTGWCFEPGSFCANHMCNLRLEYLLRVLKNKDETKKEK